jgi:hypothetical protein
MALNGMNTNEFYKIRNQIIEQLESIDYDGDLSDIGNEIGIAIGQYLSQEKDDDIESFIHGINHGISLTNETH